MVPERVSQITNPVQMLDFAERLWALAESGSLVSARLSWWWLLRWAEITNVDEQ